MKTFFFKFHLNIFSLNEIFVSNQEYSNIYFNKLTNPSFKGTIITCDLEHALNVFYSKTPMPKRFVPIPISNSFYGVGFEFKNMFAERFDEIIQGLVTGGIMKYIVEKMTKSKWNMMDIHVKSEKIVLNLSHLGFGFQICFFALYSALVTFILEFFVFWVINRSRVITCHENAKRLITTDADTQTVAETNAQKQEELNVIEEFAFGEKVNLKSREISSASKNQPDRAFGDKVVHKIPINTDDAVILSPGSPKTKQCICQGSTYRRHCTCQGVSSNSSCLSSNQKLTNTIEAIEELPGKNSGK